MLYVSFYLLKGGDGMTLYQRSDQDYLVFYCESLTHETHFPCSFKWKLIFFPHCFDLFSLCVGDLLFRRDLQRFPTMIPSPARCVFYLYFLFYFFFVSQFFWGFLPFLAGQFHEVRQFYLKI